MAGAVVGYQEIDHRLNQSLGLVVQVRVEQGVDPVGPGCAVPDPCETPPPRPEQYGAVPHIDSGILPICPSIVRRHGIPLCTGRGTSAYAVNEASPSPIGPGALQAPGHPRAAAAARLRCWWRGPGPAAVVIGTAAVKTVLPEIPPETLAEWQRVVDLTARLARVPARSCAPSVRRTRSW